ncbi:hypothetical protein JL722_6567 [Aureococcus anophagefferens]|nr:hypothetical protein JL722_6567 [Aureococcus anophagefferens]
MARAARWLGLLLCCVAGTSAVSLTTASSGLVYEPDVDFHGSDEITVTVRSAAGEFASAAVPVVIEAANDAPELAGVAAARTPRRRSTSSPAAAPGASSRRSPSSRPTATARSRSLTAERGALVLAPLAAEAAGVVVEAPATNWSAAWAPAPAKTLRLRAAPHRLRDLLAACGVTYAPPDVAGADALTARADDGALRSALATFPVAVGARWRRRRRVRRRAADEDGAAALNLTLANATEFPRGEFRASGRNAVALAHPRQLRDLVASGALVYTPARPGLEFATFLTAVATFDGEAAGEATSATCGVTSAPVNDVPRLLGPLWRGAATYRADDAEWFTDEDVPAAVRGVAAVDGATGAVDALEDAAVRLGGGLRSGIGADARRTPSPRVAAFSDADSTAASLVISLSADDAAVAFALVGDHPDVILDDGELRGLAGDLAVAFDDVELLPAPDWHGFARVALSVAAAEDEAAILASTSFLLRVRALQDAPAVVDGFHGAREVDEDAPLALTGVSVVDADYDDAAVAAAPPRGRDLGRGRRGRVLVDDDAGSLTLAGRPGELTAALASLVYTSAPDGDGGDVVDFSVDDGGAFPCDDQSCEALTGALAVPIAVASVKDAPRITAPATVRYAEAFRGVALGRNGTKRETPVAGVEFEDPDSDVLAVTVVAAGGGVRTVDRVPDVDYGDDLWSERGAVVRRATLRASPERLNAALSTLAWVGDDAAGDKDGLVAGAITITATDGDGLETTATIALEASAFNDAPVLSSDLRSAEFAEDSGWAALPAVAATDFDDATLELRAAARPEGALETTGLIRFDAVARIDDERRGAAGRARRETPDGSSDLSGESLESKLRALTNVRLSGLRVVAVRDDYAAEDPFDAEDMRYDGAKPSPAKKGGHVWRVTMSGATPGAASAPLVASVDNSSLLAAASRVARTANAVGGTLDLAVAGFCCASVAANASGADLQRALNALPSVAAVRASRSDAEDAQGGFTWSVTFLGLAPFLEANGTARAKTVDLAARSDRLTGEGAAAAATLVTARSGAPALWRVEVGHDGDRAVHAVTLGDGAGFVRLGLDTRNCSSRAGGSGYLAAGSLRWTRPIPRAAVGDLDDESYGWTVREGRVVPAYPPHAGHELGGPNSSVEAQLLRLPNWRDMGPARLDVTRHEHESSNRVTWRVTFSDAPHALPLLRVKAVEGNDDEDYDDLSLSDADAAREEAWAAANTTQTKVASLGNRANVRSRVAQGGRASTALELEAPPLGGTFRLGWGDDGQWTAPLTVGASEDDVAAALGALPAFLRPGAGRGAEFVVARDGPLAGGGYAYWPREPHGGARGARLPAAGDYFGVVAVDLAVADAAGATDHLGLTVTVAGANDGPRFDWYGAAVDVSGAGYGTYALDVDEDAEGRLLGLALRDADANPGEVHAVALKAKHGILAVHRAPADPDAVARRDDATTWHEDAGVPGVAKEPLPANRTAPAAGVSSRDDENNELVVRPVNDFPVWAVDAEARNFALAPEMGAADVAGRGVARLYGYHASTASAHDASAYFNANNYSGNGSLVVAARFVDEDCGFVRVGGLSVDDADAYSPTLDSLPGVDFGGWPAHLEVRATVGFGKLNLRAGTGAGAAAVLKAAGASDLQVVDGDAVAGRGRSSSGADRGRRAALGALAYAPDTHWNGVDVLELTASDGGDAAYGAGGPRSAAVLIALEVAPVADAPQVVVPAALETFGVDALEDEVLQFGGPAAQASQNRVAGAFAVVDDDLVDLRSTARRWLVPYSRSADTLDVRTPRLGDLDGGEANREDASSTKGTYAYANSHEQAAAGLAAHVDAGDVESDRHGYRVHRVRDRYTLVVAARRGFVALPTAHAPEDADWKKEHTLVNYTLAEANRALVGLQYVPDFNWNSAAQARKAADVAGFDGRVDGDGPLETITVAAYDATGRSGSSTYEFYVKPVNDAPVLASARSGARDPYAGEADQATRLTFRADTLVVAEDGSSSDLGATVRDVDALDVVGGLIDVVAVATRGVLRLDDAALAAGGRGRVRLSAGAEGSRLLGFSGEPDAVAAALGALNYAPDADFAGDDAVLVTASDRGNSGAGGDGSDALELPVEVRPTCDAPVVAPRSRAYATAEDAAATVGFDIFDEDHANLLRAYEAGLDVSGAPVNATSNATFFPLVSATLTAGNGSLTIEEGTRRALRFVRGTSGVSESLIAFRATIADAAAAVAAVSYAPRRDYFSAPVRACVPALDRVELVLEDLGLDFGGLPDGLGGVDCAPLVGSAHAKVRVDAVNDGPVVKVPGAVYEASDLAGSTFRDGAVRGDLVLKRIKPMAVPEDTILELGSLVSVADDADDADASRSASSARARPSPRTRDGPVDDVDDGVDDEDDDRFRAGSRWRRAAVRWRVRPGDRDAALRGLRFRGLPDAHGNASLTVAWEDGGHGGLGNARGVAGCRDCSPAFRGSAEDLAPSLHDAKTIPVVVAPVPDAPYVDSAYGGGASVEVPEDGDVWLRGVRVVDPDDADAPFTLRLAADRGSVSLGFPPPSSLRFEVGDGDMDRAVRCRGPLSAINAVLADLRYAPPRDFTTAGAGALDVLSLVVHDVDDFDRSASSTIRLRVAPSSNWNDAPALRIPNASRDPGRDADEVPVCDRRVAVASMAGFVEDVVRHPFGGITFSDADEAEILYTAPRLEVRLAVTNGLLKFDGADGLGLQALDEAAPLGVFRSRQAFRGAPDLLTAAMRSLAYVTKENWYGVDALNISVVDGKGHDDAATIILDVDRAPDRPFLEARRGRAALPLRRPAPDGRVGPAAALEDAPLLTSEDVRFRLPTLRVRDVDAEANADAVEVEARLTLRVSVHFGKVSLCALKCPGVSFLEPDYAFEARRRGGVAALAGVRAPPFEPYAVLEAGARTGDGTVRTGRPQLRWWRNATLRGTAAALTRALWDAHYWPDLNYNSDAAGREDDVLTVRLSEEPPSGDGSPSDEAVVRVQVAAANDAPVVAAARLETLARPLSSTGEAPTTGDGLSLAVVAVDDDALVTTEDEPLVLAELFSVRDADAAEAGGDATALEVTVDATRGAAAFALDAPDVLFLEPADWGAWNDTAAAAYETRQPWRDVGARRVVFLAGPDAANAALAALAFIPARDWHGSGATVTVTCDDRGNFGAGGAARAARTVKIRVREANDPPTLAAPELGGADALYLDAGGRGRLAGASAVDAKLGHVAAFAPRDRFGALRRMEAGLEPHAPYASPDEAAHAGSELWRSAPARGTRDVVDDAYYAGAGSDPAHGWRELDDRLYFAADGDGGRGAELWASDGTGSHLVADVLPGAGSSDPRFVTTYGDLLYFSARGNDARNWRVPLDHVDDCGSARQSSFEPRAHFVVAEHNVWEPGWTYDCPQGFRWMTSAEGDAAFTGANFGPSTGAGWVTGDDTSEPLVYYDQCGWEGYRWGGKAREHFRFSDSHITGSYKSAGSPDGRRPDLDRKRRGKVDLRVNKFAGIMCIEDGAYAGVSPTGAELWVSDGRTETYRAAEIRPGGPESHSDPRYLAVFDGALFMSADDGGDELWVSDGKLGFLDRDRGDAAHPSSFPEVGGAGTRVAADVFAGRPGSQPDHLACLDGTLLFAASTKREGRELWRATWKYRNDTATLDAALVKDIRPGTKPSNPSSIFAFNGRAYFAADDGVVGAELWVTDGSGANTRLLEDLRPGARGSSPKYFTALTTEASRLFFLATTSDLGDARGSSLEAPVARRLFESDGTRHGTKRVYDQTEALFDVDDEVLDAAWPRTLAPLGAALYYPARRGSTKLRGGAAAGRATSGAPRRLRTLAFAVYDVDVGESLHMTLTVDPPEAGGLTLGDLRGCTLLDGDGVRDAKLDLRGSRDELNGAMEDLSFEARDGFHGRAIVFASVKDDAPRCPAANATDGTRGPNATADDCVRGFNATAYGNATVFVRKRNLPPSIVVARARQRGADATPTLIRKAAVVDDPDATETNFGVDPTTGLRVAPRLVVTVASARGRVSLAATDAALSFLEGEGTQDRRTVFDGALPDLNRALATLAYGCWSLDGCAAGEADAINVTVDDGGFSGYGGALTASGSIPVVLVGY